jgi:hypothetical protein
MDRGWDSVAALLSSSTLEAIKQLGFRQMTPVQVVLYISFLTYYVATQIQKSNNWEIV